MVRKVKAYLENVNNNIITDEEILNRMSVELEPPTTKLSNLASSASLRSAGRPPSPTPSRTSNMSEGKKSIASGAGGAGASGEPKYILFTTKIIQENSEPPAQSERGS